MLRLIQAAAADRQLIQMRTSIQRAQTSRRTEVRAGNNKNKTTTVWKAEQLRPMYCRRAESLGRGAPLISGPDPGVGVGHTRHSTEGATTAIDGGEAGTAAETANRPLSSSQEVETQRNASVTTMSAARFHKYSEYSRLTIISS